ncbi:hypothetical protein TNCV_1680901 [Trichonephila clavipes]|nr:hypothetical protein TNCV_1680901 [Trichonephila clavipes]
MVLKANDRRTSCPCHDEFRRPRSDYVRQIRFIFKKFRREKQLQLIREASGKAIQAVIAKGSVPQINTVVKARASCAIQSVIIV